MLQPGGTNARRHLLRGTSCVARPTGLALGKTRVWNASRPLLASRAMHGAAGVQVSHFFQAGIGRNGRSIRLGCLSASATCLRRTSAGWRALCAYVASDIRPVRSVMHPATRGQSRTACSEQQTAHRGLDSLCTVRHNCLVAWLPCSRCVAVRLKETQDAGYMSSGCALTTVRKASRARTLPTNT